MSGQAAQWLCAFITTAFLQADGAVLEVSADTTNLDDLVANSEVVLLSFYADYCGWCRRLKPQFAKAEEKLRELNSKVLLAQTKDKALKKRFNVSMVPAVWLFVNGKPMYRHWAWEYDDVFDFAHSFDTMSQPAGFIFRSYIWLRSLYRFGIKAVFKSLKMEADHPVQVYAPYMLLPMLLFLLIMLLVSVVLIYVQIIQICRARRRFMELKKAA
ncbi:unnamed protein product [Durusdinium trenchii]|uniref:Thioredoxin domain-containing protein n=1 Tax=Durusdinium trenchii TaxID=1381693 RepID=A0ABP0H7S4_9DINO